MDYTKKDLIKGLLNCGIQKGDIIFSHSNIGYFGMADNCKSAEETCDLILESIFDVIGNEGTFIVPTFTYSFASDQENKIFDIKNSASNMGVFAEYVRKKQNSHRSHDPMFSVAAIGAKSEEITKNISKECFGADSFWERFYNFGGKICNFNFDSGSTFIHYVEKLLNVPYRENKKFSGYIVDNDNKYEDEITFFCRKLGDDSAIPDFIKFDELAKKAYSKISNVGRGMIVTISTEETLSLIKETLPKQPNLLVK